VLLLVTLLPANIVVPLAEFPEIAMVRLRTPYVVTIVPPAVVGPVVYVAAVLAI
jgi:hypothetical protein